MRYFQLPRNATFRTGEVPLTGQSRIFIKRGNVVEEVYSDAESLIKHLGISNPQFHDLTPVEAI